MAEQQRKKGIADLYDIEDKRRAQQATPPQSIPLQTIPEQAIPPLTIVPETIPQEAVPLQTILLETIVQKSTPPASKQKKTSTKQSKVQQGIVDESKGYYPLYNDLSDRLVPELELNPFEQSVLNRLIRLSRGWKRDECEVGMGGLAKYCVMSKSQVQRSLLSLQDKGLIENLGESKKGAREGNRYKVLPGVSTIPSKTIPKRTILNEGQGIPEENTQVSEGIVPESTNKYSNKDLLNTHSNTEEIVRVGGSRFTIEECRRYAQHLQSTGQGINNPGGYATTIHRTGEADMLIESFLHPETPDPSLNVDASQCPDCKGTGFYYPKGAKGGVARCKHEQLGKDG